MPVIRCLPASCGVPARIEPWLSPLVGLVTGLVTGGTGVFVIPAVPYVQSLGFEKDDLIQALGLSFTVSTVALAAGLALRGAYDPGNLWLSALALVPALAGMWLGQVARNRISPPAFRALVPGGTLFVLGMEMLLRPIL